MTEQTKGLLITAFGVLMIVPDSLFIRLISADTITVVFWRSFLTGSVILAGLFAIHGTGTLARFRAMGRHGMAYAFLLAFSAVLFVVSIRLTSVANTVFILATMPIFAATYSWLWLGERIGRRMVLTMIAVFAGIAVIALGSTRNEVSSPLGDFCALCLAASFALAMTVARRGRAASMVPAVPIAFLAVALVTLPVADPFNLTGFDPIYVALHGGFFIPLSTSLLAIGPRYITSAEVALLILLETVLAPLLVWLVIGENPGSWTLVGGAIVLGALFLSNLVALKRARRPA